MSLWIHFQSRWAGQAKKQKKKSFYVPFMPDTECSFPNKIQKNKKRHSCFISSKTESGQAKKEGKKFSFWLPFLPTRYGASLKKIPKKQLKKSKNKLKNVISASFLAKASCDRPKKRTKFFFVLGTVSAGPELEHSQKNCKKIQKGKKVILPSFLAKLSWKFVKQERKIFVTGTISALLGLEHPKKTKKKIVKNLKKTKTSCLLHFLPNQAKTG